MGVELTATDEAVVHTFESLADGRLALKRGATTSGARQRLCRSNLSFSTGGNSF